VRPAGEDGARDVLVVHEGVRSANGGPELAGLVYRTYCLFFMAGEASKTKIGETGGSANRAPVLSVDWISLAVALGLAMLVRLGLIGRVPW
jgi:hypothetical protein